MERQDLLNELSKLNVRCFKTLENYVDYCFEHDQHNKIKGETAHHHILPKAKSLPFTAFSDLKANSWNGVHLKLYNHYFAHWLLFSSLNESSMAYAFFKMHKILKNKSEFTSQDLVSEEEYYELYKNTYIVWNKGLDKEKQPFFGKSISAEHKSIISESNSGDNNYWRNNPMSAEHKLKNSEANKRIIKTPEWNKKNSEKRTGTKLMNNSIICKYIQPEDIEDRLYNGWTFGKIVNKINSS